jgi:hypothetical protein
MDNGKDVKKALEWMNKAMEGNANPQFWQLYQKARIQKANGDKAGALATSKASWEAAKAANNRDYQLMNEELQKSLK